MTADFVAEPYAPAAEFVEIALAADWEIHRAAIEQALRTAPTVPDAVVVDIGAGGGRGILLAARVLPQTPIVAIEPSAALRIALMSRLALDPDLQTRTTVLPTTLADARLPERWAAALVMNMAGHLEPDERRSLWTTAATHLLPGAPLVVTVQPPFSVQEVPETPFGEFHVGAHAIDVSGSARPDGPESVIWDIIYRVTGAGTPVREHRMAHRWYVQDLDTLLAELDAAGLNAEPVSDRLVVARRPEAQ